MLWLEIVAVLILTLLNGLLAMSELALISSRKSRLEHLARQGSRGARSALRLLEDPGRFLSTVQIGITAVGIVAGAFSGSTLGRRLGAWLDAIPAVSPYGGPVGIGLTVIAITYLSLVLGELVPKRIALARPERMAMHAAGPMRALSLAAAPAVWLLRASTEGVLRRLGLGGAQATTITEDEVKALIAEGTRAGVFLPPEKEMIEGVLRLADRSVRVIMTPRSRIVWADVKSGREAIVALARERRLSRLLLCDGTVDRPVGFIHTKNLLPEVLEGKEVDLSRLMTPILLVPESATLLRLLGRFRKEKVHLAVVVDEYGSTEGLVTLTDVIEAVTGDLSELGEAEGPRIAPRGERSWLADGAVPADEVRSVTGVDLGTDAELLAGFVLARLGKIPEPGTSFVYGNARFEVLDMDGRRIDKVLIEVRRS